MSEQIKWIKHKGKKILVCDFSNYNEKQYLAGVDAMEKELLKQARGSFPLLIVDVTNSHMNQVTSDRGKQCAIAVQKAGITTLTAMVGITGVKRIIAQAISRDVYFAKDMESAKEWLVT
ncbi:MAG: hypothetical protein JW822_08180 [Spirochaetales bacterium]|nr:hypothetical protein [Spirochaetales bacterium]